MKFFILLFLAFISVSCAQVESHRNPSSENESSKHRLSADSEDYLSRLNIHYNNNTSISLGSADFRIDMANISISSDPKSRILLKASMTVNDKTNRKYYEINENSQVDLIGKNPACLVYEVKREVKRILRTKYFYMNIEKNILGKYAFHLFKIKANNESANFEDILNLCSRKITLDDLSSDWEAVRFLN